MFIIKNYKPKINLYQKIKKKLKLTAVSENISVIRTCTFKSMDGKLWEAFNRKLVVLCDFSHVKF